MSSASWSERVHYQFDNFMARGTSAMVAGLGLLMLGLVVVAGGALFGLGIRPGGDSPPLGLVEATWQSLMRALSSGTMAFDSGWGYRAIMLLVTLGGVFVFSALIGVLSAGISGRIELLRHGRSRVVESGHFLLLGWSPKTFTVLSELATSNDNVRRPCVVVLASEDKVMMEAAVSERLSAGNLRVVCRSGNPIDPSDLRIGSPETARAIIVLPPEGAHGDIHTIKTLLAIAQIKAERGGDLNVVAAVHDAGNAEVARLAAGPWAHVVLIDDVIARITAQTCRQSGLSIVTQELLDFGGDEIYFSAPGAAGSMTYGEALHRCTGGTGIGLRDASGSIRLNPRADTPMGPGDRIIAIAADDDRVFFESPPANAVDDAVIIHSAEAPAAPERTLILGWNRRGDRLIAQLEHYVSAGSTVCIVAQDTGVASPTPGNATNLSVTVTAGDPRDRATLDGLDVPSYDHVIVLADETHDDPHLSDAQTLVTLLHLRDIADRSGRDLAIVSEMLDVRNRDLAVVTRADDFIVSDRLVSLLLTQIAENPELEAVFDDLFDPEGSEIYLKPAGDYVRLDRPVTFHTIIAGALRRGETAIGYRLASLAADASRAHGVVLNPDKARPVAFGPDDKVIVLAED